ncbi:MAG: hypothetical protein U5R46_12920 [Gammaproteobacteria bacterium]|nr:hypothetical protein [Gammaproteobacteria bacterium]
MKKNSRRNVLTGLAIATPVLWARPIVQSVFLPAHAQTSEVSPDPAIRCQIEGEGDHLDSQEDPTGALKDQVVVNLQIDGVNDINDIVDGESYMITYEAIYTTDSTAPGDAGYNTTDNFSGMVTAQNDGEEVVFVISQNPLPEGTGLTNIEYDLDDDQWTWSPLPHNYSEVSSSCNF